MQFAAGFVFQRLEVAAGEAGAGVRRVERLRPDLRHAHTVTRTRHRQFSIDSMAFAIGIDRVKQRRGNGIRQPVNCRGQRAVFHLQVECGAVGGGAGVMATAMFLQKLGKVFRIRVLFRPHQHHMLKVVGQPQLTPRIVQRADRQRQRRQRFGGLRIRHQQYRHAVIQSHRLVLAGIVFTLVDCFRQWLPSLRKTADWC